LLWSVRFGVLGLFTLCSVLPLFGLGQFTRSLVQFESTPAINGGGGGGLVYILIWVRFGFDLVLGGLGGSFFVFTYIVGISFIPVDWAEW